MPVTVVEFRRTISNAEVNSKYLNLTDDYGKKYGSHFPPDKTKLVIIDSKEKTFDAKIHHNNQIWGNLRHWYNENNIMPETKIMIRFNPDEKINGDHVVRLLTEKTVPLEPNVYEKIGIPKEFEIQLESFLLKDDVIYLLYNYKIEDEFEKIIFDNYKNIFGKDSIFFPKQKIKTKSGVGTIPDGYILSIKEKKWYIIEVELESHPLHEHIVTQISKFSTAIKNIISSDELKNAFYQEIINDPWKSAIFQANEITEIYKYISDLMKNMPEIVIFIDKKSIDLDDICKDLPFYTKVIVFRTYSREGTGENIYQIDGSLKMLVKENISTDNKVITEIKGDLSENSQDDYSDIFNNAMKNHIFEKLIKDIQNIDQNIEMRRPQKSMVAFYEKGSGLVWINYPNNKIVVHLRKTDFSSVEMPRNNFVPIGWGGYPEFSVYSENDIGYVIKLVKYVLQTNK